MIYELAALCAAIAFALFAVYGLLGLRVSTPLTATAETLALVGSPDLLVTSRHLWNRFR